MLKNWLDSWTSIALANAAAWLPHVVEQSATPTHMLASYQPGNGKVISNEFAGAGASMRYKVYVPRSYSGQALPVIVMLHGCRQSADDFACGTQMNVLADEWQCLIVYPEQSLTANGIRCWNWFEAANQLRGRGEPAMIAGLTHEVIRKYGANPAQVFIAGLSSGASMAVILGQTYPDLFAAVGSHSGLAYASAKSVYGGLRVMRNGANPLRMAAARRERRVPTIVFQGDMDATVHPNNSAMIVAQSLKAASWTGVRRIPGRRTVATHKGRATGRKYTRKVHSDSAGQLIVEHWIVHGSGHAWSGGSPDGSYTDVAGPNAAREMLRFFMSVSNWG